MGSQFSKVYYLCNMEERVLLSSFFTEFNPKKKKSARGTYTHTHTHTHTHTRARARANKDTHTIPVCCLPHPVIIGYHLVKPIITCILISDDGSFHILYISSVCRLYHLMYVHAADHQDIPLVLPFGNNNSVSASACNVSFFEICFCNLVWVWFTISSEDTIYVGVLCEYVLCQLKLIVQVMGVQLTIFSLDVLH